MVFNEEITSFFIPVLDRKRPEHILLVRKETPKEEI